MNDPTLLAAVAQQSEWIPTSERMPPPGDQVLAWCLSARGPYPMVDCWDEQHEAPVSFSSATIPVGLGWDSGNEFEQVSHWKPITPPLPVAPVAEATSPNKKDVLPQGYEPHELPADYTGPLFTEGHAHGVATTCGGKANG